MYIAGLVRIKLSCGFPDKKQGELELSPARAYMQHFESRYKVAGMLLIILSVLNVAKFVQRITLMA
jgi:hypothetical protein